MKLNKRNEHSENEYRSELTKELDVLSGMTEKEFYVHYHHYLLRDDKCKADNLFAIRVPGGTVGIINLDDNNTITDIEIDTGYVVKTYPDNVNELMKKYIGTIIDF